MYPMSLILQKMTVNLDRCPHERVFFQCAPKETDKPTRFCPCWGARTPPQKKKRAQVISPTACGALFSARTTPQPSQNLVEPSWNPGKTLVEPYLRAARTTPEPIWAETPKLSAVGEKATVVCPLHLFGSLL